MKITRRNGVVSLTAAIVLGLTAAAIVPATAVDSNETTVQAKAAAPASYYPYSSVDNFVEDVVQRATWAPATDETFFVFQGLMNSGQMRGGDVAAELYGQHQNTTANEHFIARSYLALQGHVPDAGGYYYWIARTRNQPYLLGQTSVPKATYRDIVGAQTRSRAFNVRHGALQVRTNSQFVGWAYTALLGRTADSAGRTYWLNQLNAKKIDRIDLIVSFLKTAEAKRRYDNETRTIVPFFAFFDKAPTYSEMTATASRLRQGVAYSTILGEWFKDPRYFLGDK